MKSPGNVHCLHLLIMSLRIHTKEIIKKTKFTYKDVYLGIFNKNSVTTQILDLKE